MTFKLTIQIFTLLGLLWGAESQACKISLNGGNNQHLGDYSPSSGATSNINLRVSCANNKAITLRFSSNQNCQLRRRQSAIIYEIYMNSGSQNYCNRRAFSGGFTQDYLLTIFARPVVTPLEAGRYSDRIDIELIF